MNGVCHRPQITGGILFFKLHGSEMRENIINGYTITLPPFEAREKFFLDKLVEEE